MMHRFLFVLLLCTASLFSVSAQKITIKMQNVKMEKIFDAITHQTGLKVAYTRPVVNPDKIVTLNATNEELTTVLAQLFQGSNITYEIGNKKIYLKDKAAEHQEHKSIISKFSVSGRVVDEKGEPIIGATITVKGEKLGTISDFEGKFSIDAVESSKITISYIGYKTINLSAKEITLNPIILSEDTKNLEEVVVVGYAPMRKSDFTGSLSSVKSSELPNSTPTLGQALVGKVAGVQVLQTSGAPGAGVKIRIRGVNSLSAGTDPLYVIDGFPATEDVYINPNDVESIDILKDAASAAIYGSRGASGVVLITTKRGKDGTAKVHYDFQYGWQQVERKLDLLDADGLRDLMIESRNNAYRYRAEASGKSWSPYDDNATRAAKGFNLSEVGISPLFFDFTTGRPVDSPYNTDWQDAIFGTATMQRHNVSVSGGKSFLKYMVSAGYLDQDGIIAPSNHKRINLRTNIDVEVTKRFNIGVNFSIVDVKEREVQAEGRFLNDGIIQSALVMFPQTPVYNQDGSYAVGNQIAMKSDGYVQAENPVALAHEIDIKNKSSRINFNTNLSFKIIDGLIAKANLGMQYYTKRYNYYRPRTVGKDGDMPFSNSIISSVKAQDITNYDNDKLAEFTLSYKKQINKHNLDLLGGYTIQAKNYDRVAIEASGFPDDRIHEITAHGPSATDVGLYSNQTRKAAWCMISYLSRLNYSFDNRYLITASFRADGSSRFGKANRWGYFPSISGGWIASNESFIKDLIGESTKLKFRASWGLSGNNNIGNYEHTSTMSSGGYVFGTSGQPAYWQGGFSDEAIGWESTSQFNIGFDLGLLNNRINLIANFYNSESFNLLYDQPISAISGSSSVKTNIKDARVRNQGFDLQADVRILQGEFKWNLSANISANKNKVLNLGGISDLYLVGERSVVSHVTRSGIPIGSFYGYISDGILSTSDIAKIMIDKSNLVNGKFPEGYKMVGLPVADYNNVNAGDVIWRDVDNDGRITDSDRDILGDAYPDFTYGFSTNMSFKNFDLSATFTGSQGGEVINFQKYYLFNNEGYSNQLASSLDRYHSDDNPGKNNVFRANRMSNNNISRRLNSYMVEDASYFRCSNITIGYNVPRKLISKVGIQDLRLSVSADNLFMLTNYEGYNPEVDYKDTNLLPGFDWGVYPLSRTYSLNVGVTF